MDSSVCAADKPKAAVSSFQLFSMSFIIGLGLNILNLPALLVMEGGRDGWLVMLIISVFDCAALYCTLAVMDYLKKTDEKRTLCRVLEIVFGVILFFWILCKLVLLIGEARLFFGKTVFDNLDWLVFLALLCTLSAVLGGGGARGLGRLSELLLPIAVVTVVVIVLTAFAGDVDFGDVFPMLYNNAAALKSPLKYALWTGNYPVLFAFFRKVEFKKHTKLLSVGAAAASGVLATALTLALSAAYGSVSQLIYYGNNAADMNQFVSNYNFGRIDLIVFTVWSIVLLAETGLFQHCGVRALCDIVGKKKPWLYSWLISLAVYALMHTLAPCDVRLFEFATAYAAPFAVVVQVLPLLSALGCLIAFAIGKVKEGRKRDEA